MQVLAHIRLLDMELALRILHPHEFQMLTVGLSLSSKVVNHKDEKRVRGSIN